MIRNKTAYTFFDHLDEFKGRFVKCLLAVVAAAFIFYPFVEKVLEVLIAPVGQIVFTALSDAFMARLQITFVGALLIASPYVFYQVWAFVSEGLSSQEREFVRVYGPVSFLFFMFGICFAYFIAIPFAVKFLLSYGSGQMVPMITVDNYISFAGTMIMSFGVIFEMPLILLFLTKIGISTPAFLIEKRRHAIVGLLILSAILTPPDIFSQIIMAIPLLILYEIGIIFSKMAYAQSVKENVL